MVFCKCRLNINGLTDYDTVPVTPQPLSVVVRVSRYLLTSLWMLAHHNRGCRYTNHNLSILSSNVRLNVGLSCGSKSGVKKLYNGFGIYKKEFLYLIVKNTLLNKFMISNV